MGLQQRRRTKALRVRYGATKPLPKPAGKYHVEPTEEEQMTAFEAATRRRRDLSWREQRASVEAMKKVMGRGK
jgi:hypothetical protein